MRKAKWLGYRRVIWAGVLLSIPIVAILMPMEWITDDSQTLCLWHNISGENCYGCGMTRATVSVLKFRFADGWHYNRLIVLAFPVLVYLWAKELRRLWRCFAGKRQQNLR